MRTVSCAVNRRSKTGQVIGENQRIPVLEALKAITVYAAYQYGEEHEKGTIAVGKTADFVVLDRNPLETDSEELAEIQVCMTVKDNEIIYKKSEGGGKGCNM